MLIHDKHEGWLTTCKKCGGEGTIERHGEGYLSDNTECFECDGAKNFHADAGDFDGKTVRLNTGETVNVEAGMFWLGGDELCEVVVADIATVLEAAAA